MTSGSQSSEALDGSSDKSDCPSNFDFVRLMLLKRDRSAVLMVLTSKDGADEFDLPYFEYPHSINRDIARCRQDLQFLLGQPAETVMFAIGAELLGCVGHPSKDDSTRWGSGKLFMVDCVRTSPEDLKLPSHAMWCTKDFVSDILKGMEKSVLRLPLELVLNCMEPDSSVIAKLSDPRYCSGWFQEASDFLLSVVSAHDAEVLGPVNQLEVSPSSTLMKVNSSKGGFFLKAPAKGCREATVTRAIAQIFPQSSPELVGLHEELNCFVSKDFHHSVPERDQFRNVLLQFGRMQVDSVSHLDVLVDNGCEIRDMKTLATQIRCWMEDKDELFECVQCTRDLREMAPTLIDICRRLEDYDIPLTLVHGDLAMSNVSVSENSTDVLFFDWEYAVISHPFCDLHRLHKDLEPHVLEEYLQIWTKYESLSRVKEAYSMAYRLGWFLKTWSQFDRLKACNQAWRVPNFNWVISMLQSVHESLCRAGLVR